MALPFMALPALAAVVVAFTCGGTPGQAFAGTFSPPFRFKRPGIDEQGRGPMCGLQAEASVDRRIRDRFPVSKPGGMDSPSTPEPRREIRSSYIHALDAEGRGDGPDVDTRAMVDPLPWPRIQAEVMVDAMSIIRHFQRATRDKTQLKVHDDDPFMSWPYRVYAGIKALRGDYGKDRPPSPWRPLIAVFDLPHWRRCESGLQMRTWHCLSKQGPRTSSGVTLAWANTYVSQGASRRTRCDKEILSMLEVLLREYPRRQVLVTSDNVLARHALKYCQVRGVPWFVQELQRTDRGKQALDILMNEHEGVKLPTTGLDLAVRSAFDSR